ncbi:universal stress protein [Kitasatospora sp. DSM 101779]|uniref:universal stress protein n=1 Tax=Kitasatospora sp. DSM 101779 TaxID=2853165 RepID=UPI0021DA9F4C|nr:universal stress protein [Kitasatospora sp. DSM 101779]MCU7826497.1 universal stress protein [Kitasatospora sp. DSM 101779]
MHQEIAVGLDGSPESRSAAHWAAREAQLREVPVRLLHVWVLPPMTAQQTAREGEQALAGERLLQDVESELREQYPDVLVLTRLVPAESPADLLPAAREAALLVVGSRGLGAVRGHLLGSVALHAAAHAEAPVVLVREFGRTAAPQDAAAPSGAAVLSGAVVAGVSLRAGHENVLEFAFAAAERHSAPLLALHADGGAPADRDALAAALLPWREQHPGVTVVERCVPDGPAHALAANSDRARLVVVGRGGHRSGPAPRLGRVAHAAVQHATCPVAVVPAT